MPTVSAQELLRRHNIAYIETRAGKYTTKCPNCNDGYLNVKLESHRVAWFCHSCDQGSSEKYDQQDAKEKTSDLGAPKAIYDYVDESGKLLFQALRFEPVNGPKQFRQRTGPDQKKWSIKGVRVVPYRLPELIDDLSLEHTVFVVEGERDVNTLRTHGVPATCNPMGAGKWWPEFNAIMRGADVVICGDNDQPGRDHVLLVEQNLAPVARRLRVLDLATIWPNIEQSDDVTDWFEHGGGTVETIWQAVDALADYKPARNGNGVLEAAQDGADFGQVLEFPSIGEPQRCAIIASPYVWVDPENIPLRDWLYGRLLVRRFLTVTIAPGGVGKSSLIACEALAMGSGRDLLGVLPVCRLKVWLWNLEDPQEETTRKIQAAAKQFNLTAVDIVDQLFVNSGREHSLVIAREVRGSTIILRPVIEMLVQQIRDHGIDVLIIDPFVSCHEVSENDNSAIDMIAKEWSRVAELANCAIHLVHHTRKAPSGTEVTTDSSRGAKALTDAARVARALNQMTEEDAVKAGVDNHRLFFRAFNDKTNLAPPVSVSNWFKLASVWLDNGPGGGDSVGVVTHWQWPDPLAGVTANDFDKVAAVVKTQDWRLDVRSTDWVGKAVAEAMGLDEEDDRDKAKISSLIKLWISAHSLEVVKGYDQQRRERKFVQVCSAKNTLLQSEKVSLEQT